jgi:opacity protein-like surface antigen
MKKIILSAAAIFAFGIASAQTDGMKFGVKAGVNNTNFTGDLDSDSQTSFYVGGFVDFSIADKFHLQPELLYSMEGADDASVSYLKIPVMGKYYIVDGFNVQAGPYIGFKVAADDTVDDGIKSMDFGLGLGAAYDLSNGLFVDARYNLGLQNISEEDSFDIKTSGIQVGVGYKF